MTDDYIKAQDAGITYLSKRRKPIVYTLEITHHWDNTVEVFVHDVADDPRSREAVGDVLTMAAEAWTNRKVAAAGDDMLAVMLANIDHAMSCTEEQPAVFRVTPKELATWADAVQKYENVRFPLGEANGDKP